MNQFKYEFKEMPYVLNGCVKDAEAGEEDELGKTNTLSGYHISLILLKNKMVTSIVLVRPGIVEINLGVLKMLSLCSTTVL